MKIVESEVKWANMKNNYWNMNLSNKDWMRRIFLPVGNGAFYCENFMLNGVDEPINVVFDCGVVPSADAASRLENVIDAAFGDYKVIHAVFLSCLESSHINGLEFLKNSRQMDIKRIYYPEIADESQWSMEKWYKLTGQQNTLAGNFCHKVEEWFPGAKRPIPHPSSNQCQPHSIVCMAKADEKGTVEKGGVLHYGEEISLSKIAGGSLGGRIASSPFADWVFHAMNFYFHDFPLKTPLFFRTLRKQRTDSQILQKFMHPCFNTNSLAVYSGPKSPRINLAQRIYDLDVPQGGPPNTSDQYAPGCLYTGDIAVSSTSAWNKLFKEYQAYRRHIGCLQLIEGDVLGHVGNGLSTLNRDLDELILVSSTESSDGSMLCNAKIHYITDEEESCLCTIVS